MMFEGTHVLLVDYRPQVLDEFDHIFSQHGAIIHRCCDRLDAIGKLWELVNKGIRPRAIITNWLLQDEDAREFYKMIQREVDLTAHNLLKNAVIMDPDRQTILICYTRDPKEATATLGAENLLDSVVVVDRNETTIEELATILMRDERTRIVEYFKSEIQTDQFRREIENAVPASGVHPSP